MVEWTVMLLERCTGITTNLYTLCLGLPALLDKKGDWRFNKRDYLVKPPPRHLPDPPAAVTNELVRTLISAINDATSNIPCWDEYAATGKRPATCDEEIPGSIYPRPGSTSQSISSQRR